MLMLRLAYSAVSASHEPIQDTKHLRLTATRREYTAAKTYLHGPRLFMNGITAYNALSFYRKSFHVYWFNPHPNYRIYL